MSRLSKITTAFAASTILAAGLLLAGGLPANAVTINGCPEQYVCIWRDHDYQTNGSNALRWWSTGNDNDLSDNYFSSSAYPANDATSSLTVNGTSCNGAFYKDWKYTGGNFTIARGGARNNLLTSVSPALFNDSISSIRWIC